MAISIKSKNAISVGIGSAVLLYIPFPESDPATHYISDMASDETLSAVSGTDAHGTTLGVADSGSAVLATSETILGTAQTLPDGTDVGANRCVRFLCRAISGQAVVGTEYELKCYVTTSAGQTLERIVRVYVEA